MAIKHRLNQSIYTLLKHNRDGSYSTQTARRYNLYQAASDLIVGGFKLKNIHNLKQKHIRYLCAHWQAQGISTATLKNRMAHLRWTCEKLGKANMMPSNDALGIGKRQYVNNANKAIELTEINLAKITDPLIKVSLHLQRYLGLRREEAIKIKPHQADKGTYIGLEASWCKGGRARTVPITTPEARYWLDEAKKLVAESHHALIPPDKKYVQQLRLYDKQTQQADIQHPHGLRHAYAQDRYKTLTGWECPKRGGPTAKELTAEQRVIDQAARLTLSADLGHGRLAITKVYCG